MSLLFKIENRDCVGLFILLSVNMNYRLRVLIRIDEGIPIPTISDLYSCASWYEREVWDMFGI